MDHVDTIYLDIETIPSQEKWVRKYVAKNTTPPGSIKKQESIDKWYKESHAGAVEAAMDKCSFDGATNHIICIGLAVNDGGVDTLYMEDIKAEKENLAAFFATVSKLNFPTFVGHNISSFDMKIIRQRSIVLGIRPPSNMPFDAKPWDPNPFDTLVQWDSDRQKMISLDKLAKALGIQGKSDIDGSMVYGMWKEGKFDEIAQYCADDVRMVRDVYKRMTFQKEKT